MIELLFESPITLGGICLAACLLLLVLWRRTGSAGRRKAFLVAVGTSVVLLVLQAVVVTDRERIIALVEDLAEAAERADVDTIEQSIDAAYGDRDGDRAVLLPKIRDRLTRYTIRGVHLSAFEVSVSGDRATAAFRVICEIRDRDHSAQTVASRWEVGLVRRGDVWMLNSIRLLQLGPIKVNGAGGEVPW